jgi:hypothetical protein
MSLPQRNTVELLMKAEADIRRGWRAIPQSEKFARDLVARGLDALSELWDQLDLGIVVPDDSSALTPANPNAPGLINGKPNPEHPDNR